LIGLHERKVWACWNILGGYLKQKYGPEIPEAIQFTTRQVIEGMKSEPKFKKRLDRSHEIGDGISIVPSDIDVYLLGIGIERGKHYI